MSLPYYSTRGIFEGIGKRIKSGFKNISYGYFFKISYKLNYDVILIKFSLLEMIPSAVSFIDNIEFGSRVRFFKHFGGDSIHE